MTLRPNLLSRAFQRGNSRFKFYVDDVSQTVELGYAFSRVVRGMALQSAVEKRPLRVGLRGWKGIGKTALINSVMHAFPVKEAVMHTPDLPGYRPQALWTCPNGGQGRIYIRHYDALIQSDRGLYSYIENHAPESPLVDLVEHPGWDMHNREFDCLIAMRRPPILKRIFNDEARKGVWLFQRDICITVTPALVASESFQEFLRDTATIRQISNSRQLAHP